MAEEKQEEAILTERRGPVLLIRINRPKAKNSFNPAAAAQMEAALDAYEEDPELAVAVITGNEEIFSSGQDLKAAARGERSVGKKRGGFGIMARPPMKPLIAAIEGPALAGGFEVALSCDLIVASRSSVFGLPEGKRSRVAVGGGCFRLPNRLPYPLAMELILTGDPLPAERLYQAGLVNALAEPGKALDAAMELAERIGKNGPLAVRASKEIGWRAKHEGWQDQEGWKKQMEMARPVFKSEDFREGLVAFAEKRDPVWKGR